MYIDLDTVIRAASVISSIGVIIGVIVAVYKVFQINRKQSDFIKSSPSSRRAWIEISSSTARAT